MKNIIFIVFISTVLFSFTDDFIASQKKYERVKNAYSEKETKLLEIYKSNNLKTKELNILIVAYKEEQQMDIYAKNKTDKAFKKILSYSICAKSGSLGPKRKMGDGQVPEGFYHINRFNPASSYYLSLGLNYPNLSDKKKSRANNLGGDIFIHGECVTIGCMPMTNDKIKEIYLIAIQAKQNGQNKIPVYIFPFIMDENNCEKYFKQFQSKTELIAFWKNLKEGFKAFDKNLNEINVKTSANGDYLFN